MAFFRNYLRVIYDPYPITNVLLFGYSVLRFAFHPGSAQGPEGGGLFNVFLKATTFPLVSGGPTGFAFLRTDNKDHLRVDLNRREWQTVEIPLDLFDPASTLRFFRLQGNLEGTFYLDDMRLVSAASLQPPATAVLEDRAAAVPQTFSLSQNYPNPFNSSTAIRFALPSSEEVELAVFNLAGQKVVVLVEGQRGAGEYSLNWDGRDERGQELASGMYLYRLRARKRMEMRKLLLLR